MSRNKWTLNIQSVEIPFRFGLVTSLDGISDNAQIAIIIHSKYSPDSDYLKAHA